MRSTSDHDAHRALPGDVAPPTDTEFDDTEHLVPILDVDRTAGWYEGWRYEFSYVSFRGESRRSTTSRPSSTACSRDSGRNDAPT